jgi:hypothetical protein
MFFTEARRPEKLCCCSTVVLVPYSFGKSMSSIHFSSGVLCADLLSFVLRSLASVSRYNFVALYHIRKHHDGMALQDGKADMPIPFFVFV